MTIEHTQPGAIPPERSVLDEIQAEIAPLSVRQLMWQRFKRNRLAGVGGIIVIAMYVVSALAGFFAPYARTHTHSAYAAVPATPLHILDTEGKPIAGVMDLPEGWYCLPVPSGAEGAGSPPERE